MEIYTAGDYAGFHAMTARGGRVSGYYGYEVTDEEENWCFLLTHGAVVIVKYPYPVLQAEQKKDRRNEDLDQGDVRECLMAGFVLAVEQGYLRIAGDDPGETEGREVGRRWGNRAD